MKRAIKSRKKEKVLVCMSGGVDSSVAAALLLKQGYNVTGAFMVNYDSGKAPAGDPNCWLPEYRDALRVAAHLGIPLLKLDFTKEYSEKVLSYMFREYEKGRTPNPDVLCNTFIKFGVWLVHARKLGFEKLATGHYARLQQSDFRLLQAKDANKDQTYFLHQLNQGQLSHVLFPVGNLLKSEVRSLARKLKLPTANKEESMGICFVGEVPIKEFLAKKVKAKKGKVVTTSGEAVGEHNGLPFYTIGQRHLGLQQSDFRLQTRSSKTKSRSPKSEVQSPNTMPLYVVDKNFKKNELVVGHEDDPALYKREITLSDVHWVAGRPPKFPLQCEVRLRHRQSLQEAIVGLQQSDFRIAFTTPQRAVAPGQFAVFYVKGECLGGGVIV